MCKTCVSGIAKSHVSCVCVFGGCVAGGWLGAGVEAGRGSGMQMHVHLCHMPGSPL